MCIGEYTVVNNVIVGRRVTYYCLFFGRRCVFWPEPTRIVAYGRDDVVVAGYPHPSSDIIRYPHPSSDKWPTPSSIKNNQK
jgi:hypothetical protein